MAKNTHKQYSFKDKIDIALNYTNGNEDLAKEVVGGNLKDVIAIKARFKTASEDQFGLFVVYLSNQLNKLIGTIACLSSSPSIFNNKPFEPWKSFEQTIDKQFEVEPRDSSTEFENHFINSIDEKSAQTLIENVKKDKYEDLNNFFQSKIGNHINNNTVYVQLETEQTTSVEIEIQSNCIKLIAQKDQEEDLTDGEQVVASVDNRFAGNVILQGKVVLSPVRGQFIFQLREGENIKVLITEKSKKAVNIATKLDAYKNDEMQALVAKVESYKRLPEGHELYASIAPYILVKILESEDVKVATVNKIEDTYSDKISKKNVIIILTSVLILLILVIIFFLNLN